MKQRCFLLRAAGLTGAALALWAATAVTSEAVSSASYASALGQPIYMQQGGVAPAWTSASGGGGKTSRTHLPNSTMPHNNQQCSVDTTDAGAPPTCSVIPGTASPCSAHCDAAQVCSAFSGPPGAGFEAQCSTTGGTRNVCSVLQPGRIPPQGDSLCSAFNNVTSQLIQCSVLGAGRKQFCSAENPNQAFNQCSAFTNGARANCSVLNGGLARKNFCSTVRIGQKVCSTFGPNTQCSIAVGSRGICSNLLGAFAGSCSAHTAGSHCSVIGGAPGTLCRQP